MKFGSLVASWKTTAGGVVFFLALLFGQLEFAFDDKPETNIDWNLIVAGAAALWTGLTARDNAVTSERARSTGGGSRFASLLLVGLFACLCSSASAADINLIVSGGKYHQVTKDAAGNPVTKVVTVQIMNLDGTEPSPGPSDPQNPASGFESIASKLTTDAVKSGGTATTAAAISSVYSVVSDSVAKGDTAPDKALPAVNFLLDGLLNTQADVAKWAAFRISLGNEFDKVRQDGLLKTKEQYAKAFQDVASGINKAVGFNGSLTEPKQTIDPNSGLLDSINIPKLMELIKFIMELWKLFSPAVSLSPVSSTAGLV